MRRRLPWEPKKLWIIGVNPIIRQHSLRPLLQEDDIFRTNKIHPELPLVEWSLPPLSRVYVLVFSPEKQRHKLHALANTQTRHSLKRLSHTLRSVAGFRCNCRPRCRRACLSSEIMSGERGGIMKSGTHNLSTGFICSTLAIHKTSGAGPSSPFLTLP